MGARAAEVLTPVTARRQDGFVRAEAMRCAVFHVQSNDTHALAVLHDQVEGKVLEVLDEVDVVTQRLAVECVQEGMASTVSGGCATVGLEIFPSGVREKGMP